MAKARTCLIAAVALGTLSLAAHAEKWDMPLAYPAANYHSINAADFGTCVHDKTSGKLDIVTHPNGSLFGGDDIKRAVQTGQVNIGERVLSAHENENPIYGLEAIPFLATSFDASDKLWKAGLPVMKEVLDKQNLVYLYSVPWPSSDLYTKKEIHTMDDLKGIKFRTYNAAQTRIAELTGLVPVQVEAADLSQALATGVVDAIMTSSTTGVDSKVWEPGLKYYYAVQAWLPRNTVFVNKKVWNGLDDATRAALVECGNEAYDRGLQTAKDLSAQYQQKLVDNGIQVLEPSADLKQGLAKVGETMTTEWLQKAGADGQKILDAYRKPQS